MPRFEFDKVAVELGGPPVLSALSMAFDEPRIGVIGANGSGKSTFLRLLNGLQLASAGHVRLDGADIAKDPKAARRRVGFLFQNPDHQIVYPTVAEDLAFGLKSLRLGQAATDQRVADGLARFGMTDFAGRSVYQLSGGEKQMIALIGVLIMRPDTIVMDEPTTLLDHRNKRRIMDAVARAEEQIVMASHDLDLLRGFDRVFVLEAGRLVFDGAPDAAIDAYLELPL
ncbi:MAG: energy-coupling factor ABC transporter ATP-binding protein [Neomegalonema sp.]|nr:energy-coupling factor ABC transporter ATP-binding protein [Neomegalonema sp.]